MLKTENWAPTGRDGGQVFVGDTDSAGLGYAGYRMSERRGRKAGLLRFADLKGGQIMSALEQLLKTIEDG